MANDPKSEFHRTATLARKKAKMGRPKLPKGEAKGRIVPVRFNRDDLRAIEVTAKRNKQVLSEWVRASLPLDLTEQYEGYVIYLETRKSKYSGGFEAAGWITKQENGANPIPVVAPGGHPTKSAALDYGIAWCKELIDAPWKQENTESKMIGFRPSIRSTTAP